MVAVVLLVTTVVLVYLHRLNPDERRLLAQAPSMILTATLDDAAVVEDRPNIPGTVDERPNWSLALPVTLEELERSPAAAAIAEALRRDQLP